MAYSGILLKFKIGISCVEVWRGRLQATVEHSWPDGPGWAINWRMKSKKWDKIEKIWEGYNIRRCQHFRDMLQELFMTAAVTSRKCFITKFDICKCIYASYAWEDRSRIKVTIHDRWLLHDNCWSLHNYTTVTVQLQRGSKINNIPILPMLSLACYEESKGYK